MSAPGHSHGNSFDCLADTAYQRGKLPRHELDMLNRPYPFTDYPNPVALPVIEEKTGPATADFWECFTRSGPQPADARLPEQAGAALPQPANAAWPEALAQVAAIAQLAAGITRPAKTAHANLRAWASAGALYPCELYFSLAGALYHYTPFSGAFSGPALHPLPWRNADPPADFAPASSLPQGPAFFISAKTERTRWKYKERACRYIHLDAGHLAANLELACRAAGLGWQQQSAQSASLFAEAMGLATGLPGGLPTGLDTEEALALFTCQTSARQAQAQTTAPLLPPAPPVMLGEILQARRSQRVFSGPGLTEADSARLLRHLLPPQPICSIHIATGAAEKAAIATACLDQNFSARAALHVVLWAEQSRLAPHNFHLALQEAGRAGQRLYLAATAMNLAVCGMAAFYDAELAQAANLPKGAAPLYVLACG